MIAKNIYIVAHLAEPCEQKRGLYEVNRKVYEKKDPSIFIFLPREREHNEVKNAVKNT